MLKIRNKTIFLFGYYGRNNIGDEIMLNNILKIFDLKEAKKVFLLSASEKENINLKNTELCVIRGIKNNPLLFLWSLLSADIFIWGGGTCFFERPNKRGLWELYVFFILRKLFFKPNNYFIGIGLEPLDSSKKLVKNILSLTKGVIYRDDVSSNLHNEYFDDLKMEFMKTFDDLVIHKFSLNISDNVKELETPSYLTFSGHFKYGREMAKHVAVQLFNISKINDLKILFLPAKFGFVESDDNFHIMVREELNKFDGVNIIDNIKIESNVDFCSYLKKSKLHIGMRLHSLIIADIFGIPNIPIAYQNKIYQYNQNAMDPSSEWGKVDFTSSNSAEMEERIERNTKNYDEFIK